MPYESWRDAARGFLDRSNPFAPGEAAHRRYRMAQVVVIAACVLILVACLLTFAETDVWFKVWCAVVVAWCVAALAMALFVRVRRGRDGRS